MKKGPLILAILDGFGDFETNSKTAHINKDFNAIYLAKTPTWDYLSTNYPKTELSCSGINVGLPDNQMGNSEVGHMNIGSGRVVYQDLTRINKEIENKNFYTNPALLNLINKTKSNNKDIHILTLLSDGGIHSHISQLFALIELIKINKFNNKVYYHLILDGRDTPPKSGEKYINQLIEIIKKTNIGEIKTICGRYYAMDRDQRWDRIEKAYNLITKSEAEYNYNSINTAIDNLYKTCESDEFVPPILIGDKVSINNGDSIVFTNFRSDRTRQLCHALLDSKTEFPHFSRNKINFTDFVTFTKYEDNLDTSIAFSPIELKNSLGEILSKNNLSQLRIAETEKYAHVTFFFSAGKEQEFKGETRILVPSPKVATYDLQPEMNLPEITNKICEYIENKKFDVIITNFANPDMVGHTGNLQATKLAIEAVDKALGEIYTYIKKYGGELLITADHGNAEIMYDEKNDQPHTAHTTSLVPFVYVGKNAKVRNLPNKKLSDIAPTILYLLGINKPEEMTGDVVFELLDK